MSSTLMPQGRQRYYNNDGTLAAGCLLYTYAAGTLTPKQTTSDAAGLEPNPNPIVLDAKGEAVIFWDGVYKVDLKTAAGAQITGWPVDNLKTPTLPGDLAAPAGAGTVGFVYATAYAVGSIGRWLKDLALGPGSTFIGFVQAGVSAIVRTMQAKARESVSIADFGAVTTDLTGVINNAAIAAALAAHDTVLVPPGTFYVTGDINAKNKAIIGADPLVSALKLVGTNTNASMLINGGSIATAWGSGGGITLRRLRLIGNWDGSTANAETDISLIGGLLKWWAGSYVKIQNCTIESFYGFGIFSYKLGYSEISSNHVFVGAKNGIHLEAPDGNNAVTSTIVASNSVHSIRGTGTTGGSGIYLKNIFTCPTFDNIIEDVVNGITIDGQDNRNPTLLANHVEQNTGPAINALGSWNAAYFAGNIFATLPAIYQVNAEFSQYTAVNNFQLDDTITLASVSAAPAQVSLVAATPKTTINSIVLTPGEWDVTAAWTGVNASGAGQLSARQEFALNTAESIPAYSSGFDKAALRGDCASTVNTGDGFLNGTLSLKIKVAADTTLYLYGGAASITSTLSISCTGWIKARRVGGIY